MSPLQRTLAAAALFSTWMVCLLSGWAFGGAIHLALALALVVFPWRESRR
jgi:enoyl-CoA hydratase/carnithine racemase